MEKIKRKNSFFLRFLHLKTKKICNENFFVIIAESQKKKKATSLLSKTSSFMEGFFTSLDLFSEK